MGEDHRIDRAWHQALLEVLDPGGTLQRSLEIRVVVSESIEGSPESLLDVSRQWPRLGRLAEEQGVDVEQAPQLDDRIRVIIDAQVHLDVTATAVSGADSSHEYGGALSPA